MEVPYFETLLQYKSIKNEIDFAIQEVISQGRFVGGETIALFESEFSGRCNVNQTVSCGNATDGLFVALKALKIGTGDEVLVSALTWISDSEAVSLCGAKPVFVDVESDFYCIDPKELARKISKNTKAIIVTHLFGQSAQMDSILQVAQENRLFVIEDCAQAHFAEFDEKKVGTFGHIGVFSFYPTKNLGAFGDAGCLVTQEVDLAQFCRRFCNHGALQKDDHWFEGINSRMDTIQAAILRVKLRYIDKWIAKRNIIAQWYFEGLHGINGLMVPRVRPLSRHTFHIFAIRTKKRNELRDFLLTSGIKTEIHYPLALPFAKPYQSLNHSETDFPVASDLQNELLSLPMYPELDRYQINYICDRIRLFIG